MCGNKINLFTQFSFKVVNYITSKYMRYDLYSLQMSILEINFEVCGLPLSQIILRTRST